MAGVLARLEVGEQHRQEQHGLEALPQEEREGLAEHQRRGAEPRGGELPLALVDQPAQGDDAVADLAGGRVGVDEAPHPGEHVLDLEAEVDAGHDVERRLHGLEAVEVAGPGLGEGPSRSAGVEQPERAVDRRPHLAELVDGLLLGERRPACRPPEHGPPPAGAAPAPARPAERRAERDEHERARRGHPGRRRRRRPSRSAAAVAPSGQPLAAMNSSAAASWSSAPCWMRSALSFSAPSLIRPWAVSIALVEVAVGVLDRALDLLPDLVELLVLVERAWCSRRWRRRWRPRSPCSTMVGRPASTSAIGALHVLGVDGGRGVVAACRRRRRRRARRARGARRAARRCGGGTGGGIVALLFGSESSPG